jgi:hypothetical protein
MVKYTIDYIETHVIINSKYFYVWYDDHYVNDFIKLSNKIVKHIATKSNKRLKSYYKLTCETFDVHLHGYSKSTLKRKLRRIIRKTL